MASPSRRLVAGAGLALIAAAAAVAVLRSRGATPPPPGQAEVLRVGYLPITTALPFFVAMERGFFKQRGLEIKLERFETSPLLNTALLNGDVDAITSIAYSAALTTESRDPGRLKVFMADAESPERYLSALVALPSSGIQKVEDLRGKKVGIFPGPTARTFFGLALKKHGLDAASDLTLVELPAPAHPQALASGQVDALLTYEPAASVSVLRHGATLLRPGLIESEVINPWQAGVWLVSSRLLQERPRTAKRWMDALFEAVDFMAAHPEEAKAAFGAYVQLDPQVSARLPLIPCTRVDQLDRQAFQQHADLLQEAGVLSKRIDSAALLVDPASLAAGPGR